MQRRLLFLGFLSAAAAALLASCGGGGGGTGTPPVVNATASALPVSSSATIAAGATSQTAVLATIAAGYGATLSLPGASAGAGSVALAFALTPPTGFATIQSSIRRPAAIGGTLTPVVYLSFTPSATISFAATPAFTFTLPAGAISSGSYYVGLFDPTTAAGWVTLLGPDSASQNTVSFSAGQRSETFVAGATYVFALFATSQALVPASPTPFPGGASEVASFASNMPAAAHSAAFTFTPATGTGAVTVLAAVPHGCSASSACSITVSAPVGTNESVQVLLFASTDGSGTALAVGTVGTSFIANQSTSTSFGLKGVMASFTVSLSPATFTPGQPLTNGQAQVQENAFDAAGEALAPGYVTTGLQNAPQFIATVSDTAGQLSVVSGTQLAYSGAGAGPASVTVQAPSYPTVTANVSYAAAAPLTIAFAAGLYGGGDFTSQLVVGEYAAGASTATRQFDAVYHTASGTLVRFDPNETLWGGPIGVKSDGSSAGTLPFSDRLLAFDANGNAYASNITSNALNVYALSGSSATLLRSIASSGAVCSAAPDVSGNIYVGLCSGGVREYAAGSTSGTVTPIASDATAFPPVAVDRSGDVIATATGSTLVVYGPGVFGHGAPTASCVISVVAFNDVGVDTSGNVYVAAQTLSGTQQATGTITEVTAATIARSGCTGTAVLTGAEPVTVALPLK